MKNLLKRIALLIGLAALPALADAPVPVALGGTGQTTAATALYALLSGLGTPAVGDIYYNTGTAVAKLPIGSTGSYLGVSGGIPAWGVPSISLASITAGSIATTGGTYNFGQNFVNASPVSVASTPGFNFNCTYYSGGSSSTTYPCFYINAPGAATPTFNTNGAFFAINGPAGGTNDLFDFYANGAARLSMNYLSQMTGQAKWTTLSFDTTTVGGSGGPAYQIGTSSTGMYSQTSGADVSFSVNSTLQASFKATGLDLPTIGAGLRVAEGTNGRQGVATLAAGTVTVSNTSITSTTRIMLTEQDTGTCTGFVKVSARTAGTSFVITSSVATDTCTVAYELFEPG